MKIAVINTPAVRSRIVCTALAQGAIACGDSVELYDEGHITHGILPEAVAAFYSLGGNLRHLLHIYAAAKRPAVFVDLGYWKRKSKGAGLYTGYHRYSISELHAVSTFRRRQFPADRFESLGIEVRRQPRAARGHIVLAGMQPKSGRIYDLDEHEYEERAVEELKKHTDREIVYCPKPSWDHASPIDGTTFAYRPGVSLMTSKLEGAWALVTHHSNAAIDALTVGVPVIGLDDGLARVFSRPFDQIENPYVPTEDETMQFLYAVAYAQWNVDEMRRGLLWRHLKEEGLLDVA